MDLSSNSMFQGSIICVFSNYKNIDTVFLEWYIAGSSHCTTKSLSLILTTIIHTIKQGLSLNSQKVFETSGIKTMLFSKTPRICLNLCNHRNEPSPIHFNSSFLKLPKSCGWYDEAISQSCGSINDKTKCREMFTFLKNKQAMVFCRFLHKWNGTRSLRIFGEISTAYSVRTTVTAEVLQ